jgi:hypothetical protein
MKVISFRLMFGLLFLFFEVFQIQSEKFHTFPKYKDYGDLSINISSYIGGFIGYNLFGVIGVILLISYYTSKKYK